MIRRDALASITTTTSAIVMARAAVHRSPRISRRMHQLALELDQRVDALAVLDSRLAKFVAT